MQKYRLETAAGSDDVFVEADIAVIPGPTNTVAVIMPFAVLQKFVAVGGGKLYAVAGVEEECAFVRKAVRKVRTLEAAPWN